MLRTYALTFAGLTLLASACGGTDMYGRDVPEVGDRYTFKYRGQCSSWLYSQSTGHTYCASPPFDVALDLPPIQAGGAGGTAEAVDETKVDKASLMAHGEKKYNAVCAACHQANGEGLAGSFPPLAGAGEFYGDPQNHARIIVHGLSGPITVKGQAYNSAMPPQGGTLSDYDIAAIATFERHSWGNDDGIVLPADVAAVR